MVQQDERPPELQVITVADNDLQVFVETPPLVAAMVDDIDRATRRVWVECYTFAADAAGEAIAEALMRRARAGVDVRVLYDALGSQATPARFFTRMSEAGIAVKAYQPLWDGLRRFALLQTVNRRNHRKLLVVDDHVCYFGGMNIIDEGTVVANGGLQRELASSGWRDVHLRLSGPQQAEVAESFDRSWRAAHGEPIRRRTRAYRRGTLPGRTESIRFFDSGPGAGYTKAARVYHRLIRRARSSITFSMAYFLPIGAVSRSLMRARRRGVRIRVIVPNDSDVKLVEWATRHQYRRLLRRGFVVYERQRRMLHSKLMVVDRQWVLVGSCNFDARSLWFNLEFMAVIRSRQLARVMAEICRHEMRHSQRVTRAHVRRYTRWQRLVARLAYSLRWWL